MNDSLTPAINREYFIEQFDNEILLYSVTNTQAIHLNETAFLVYGMCNSHLTIGEIVAQFQAAYPDHHDTIRDDVIQALSTLVESKAISLS